MFDIESKRYRVRTTGIPGQVQIIDKREGGSEILDIRDLPVFAALSRMTESEFDSAVTDSLGI